MSFSSNIPAPNNFISADQPKITDNFTKENNDMGVDHIPFTTPSSSGSGQHRKVTFNNTQLDPAHNFPITQLYTKTSAGPNTFNDLYYYEKGSASGTNVLRLTGGGITAAAYGSFNGASGALISGYNITSGAHPGLGGYSCVFTREFANVNYTAVITPDMSPGGGFAIKIITISKGFAGFSFQIQNQTNANSNCITYNLIIFGDLK